LLIPITHLSVSPSAIFSRGSLLVVDFCWNIRRFKLISLDDRLPVPAPFFLFLAFSDSLPLNSHWLDMRKTPPPQPEIPPSSPSRIRGSEYNESPVFSFLRPYPPALRGLHPACFPFSPVFSLFETPEVPSNRPFLAQFVILPEIHLPFHFAF